MGEGFLGGKGDLNLPFEKDPLFGTAGEARLDLSTIATGVIVMATVIRNNPVIPEGHPAVVFRFAAPDGQFYSPIALIVEENELRDLKHLVGQAVDNSITGARKDRKRRAS